MTTPTITLTGIQPTGELHLGNYAGAIRPLAQLAAQPSRETYVFVADLHALNSRPDPDQLRDRTRKMAAALLASGLDHDRVHVYRQSRVPAIAQISACCRTSPARERSTGRMPTRRSSPPIPPPDVTPTMASTWACSPTRC